MSTNIIDRKLDADVASEDVTSDEIDCDSEVADEVRAVIRETVNAWDTNPILLAKYTNGLLVFGVLVSLIFHFEVGYTIYLISSETLDSNQLLSLTYKLSIWAAIHQVPIALHGAGTISLRHRKQRVDEIKQWQMKPWTYGTEIFGVSFLISLILLLWGTHVWGAKYVCIVIAVDLFIESAIWAVVRYVKDYKTTFTMLLQIADRIPKLK